MYNRKNKFMAIAIVSVMILSAFAFILPMTSAQSTSSTPVGTVTLNPSSGAFPGQLVTYTWTGVPTDLVSPVYVTVYLNGAPYSTGVATYSNGVLTGTFTMPNDQPGTSFSLSFSYKDSAQNYGVSSFASTGTTNVYGAPVSPVTTTTPASIGIPYTVKADLNLSGVTPVKTQFPTGTGYLNGYTNTSFSLGTGSTSITNESLTTGTAKILTNYSMLENFTGKYKYQNIYVNATTLNGGQAILSLPATAKYNSNFTFGSSSISGITLYTNISTTWNGKVVSFVLEGKYVGTISSAGNYSFSGAIRATSPSLLANTFTGSFSASYDIVSFGVASNGTHYVNYTLSTALTGQTANAVVTLSAQYLNATLNKASSNKAYINSTDSLTVQSGYKFQSEYIDIENPGINGTYLNNFYHGNNYTGNLTFTFKNYTIATSSALSTLVWYDNMSASMKLSNQTLKGYLNLTVNTTDYSPGVADISDVVWEFSLSSLLHLNDSNGLLLEGSGSNSSLSYFYPGTNSSHYNYITEVNNISLESYFLDYLGNPYFTYFNVPYTPFALYYNGQTAIVKENFTFTGNLNLSSVYYTTKTSKESIYSNVSGFNETLSGPMNLYVNVSNVEPVVYAIAGNGLVTLNITIKGAISSKYISDDFYGNLTYTTPLNLTFVNQYGSVVSGTVSNNTTAAFALKNIYGTISNAYITSGNVQFTSPFYQGSIGVNGNSSKPATSIALTPDLSGTSDGTITSVSGFKNTTILGFYNTTFTVGNVVPALYGISVFTGYAMIYSNVSIKNVSHSLTIDPYYQGLQNSSFVLTIPSEITSINNTFKAMDNSQNLTLVGYGYKGYLNDFTLSGEFNVTDSLYNLTDTFMYQLSVPSVTFFTISPFIDSTVYNGTQITFVSGDVPTVNNITKTELYAMVASPILNLTLTPLANISFSAKFFANDGMGDFNISGSFNGKYVFPYAVKNNSIVSFSSMAKGSANVTATVEETQFVFNGIGSGITFTTNPVYVENAGPIYVSGVSTAQFGSGTLTGTVYVQKLYPVSMDGAVLSGTLDTSGFLGNGTQYSLNSVFASSPVTLSTDSAVSVAVPTAIVTQYVSEYPNMGVSPAINYALVSGSGALILSLSNNTIAQIATKTGQVINVSLDQLNAKISNVWSAQNTTYATLTTDFGTMMVALNNINSTITGITNGIVTIQTSLGTVQTSLSNINGEITAVNGNVATVQTSLGTVQTSLNNLNATVTSISGGVATVQTSLGTLQGTVTSISNGIATIQTNIGTLQTSVSTTNSKVGSVSSSVGNTMIFEVVVLVLVLITLVLAFLAMNSSNKLAKKLDEQKKQ